MNKQNERVVTCVYCGMAYPDGTPRHGSAILTEHIKECEKHPLRKAEQKIERLRKALAAFIGTSLLEELKQMKLIIQANDSIPDLDKKACLEGIDTLIDLEEQ